MLAVQTSRRPLGSSLSDTLRSLADAGLRSWGSRTLIVSDGYQPPVDGWEISASSNVLGSAKTFMRLMRQSLARWPELEYLTVAQDDIEVCAGALEYLPCVQAPGGCALVSWFSETIEPTSDPTLLVFEGSRFFDAQLITLTRHLVDLLAAIEFWPTMHQADLMIAKIISDRSFAVHVPNLCDHTQGRNSACEHGHLGNRRSASFPGRTFDARSWKGWISHGEYV